VGRAIDNLLTNDGLRRSLAANAHAASEATPTWETEMPLLVDLYCKLTA
jgi:hypothetical protein